jgi:hypothetical protein
MRDFSINGVLWRRIRADANGNSRHVCHWTEVAGSYDRALELCRPLGGRRFHNKSYGGGIVFQVMECELPGLSDMINTIPAHDYWVRAKDAIPGPDRIEVRPGAAVEMGVTGAWVQAWIWIPRGEA